MKIRVFFLAIAIAIGLVVDRLPADDQKPINLLQPSVAVIERASLAGDATRETQTLFDGDPATQLSLDVVSGEPLLLVFGFGGEMVSLERLVIAVPNATDDATPAEHVDLLVSSVSPHAGFSSVRTDILTPGAKPQEFGFTAVGAKWIMLRFTPADGAKRMLVGDVSILGYKGAPASRYSFKESPAKAFDVLKQLENSTSVQVAISQEEADLFEDTKDGKLDRWSFDEAALLASGVHDAAKRKQYIARLQKLEEEARTAIGQGKSAFDRGDALLKHLHTVPMANGYVAKQTDVSTILDDGTFNCVSSATLFNILGKRLGLDVRAIEVPNHAFSILYDGTLHADVETTSPGGFNPARDPAAQEAFTRLTGFAYIPDSNRDQRREVGETGLIAIIYYNHGVGLMEEKRHQESLVAFFCAMSMDREFDSAVKNALAVVANWGVSLANEKKFEDALNVVSTGLALAPDDAALVNNHKAVWSEWADSLIKESKSDEALAVLRRAAVAIPDGNFVQMQSWVFIQPGEELVKAGQWEQALASVEPGQLKLDAGPREELIEWGRGLYYRWSESEMKNSRFESAIDILEKGLKESADDGQLPRQIAYLVQEWLRSVYLTEGMTAAEKVMSVISTRFPQSDDVRSALKGHSQNSVRDLIKESRFEEALAMAERNGKLLTDAELTLDLSRVVYDTQVSVLVEASDWQAAIDVYTSGLVRLPADKHLENNLQVTWDAWAQSFSKTGAWEKALDVYAKAVKQLSDPSRAKNNIRYFLQEWAKDSYAKDGAAASFKVLAGQIKRFSAINGVVDVGRNHVGQIVQDLASQAKYDEALTAAEAGKELLKDDAELGQISTIAYDSWADELQRKKDWQGAIDVYTKALQKFPEEGRLEQNAVATWYQWAKTYMDAKEWSEAIKVYEQALKQFPDNGTFKNNLEYCQQELKKKTP